MAASSSKAVYTAIVGNTLVMLAKFAGFVFSGSAVMLSEAIHSLADVGNQSLLALGMEKSKAPATDDFPYGFSRDRFIWALVSAVGIFFLGCGVTLYHGVHALLADDHSFGGSPLLLGGVLLFSLVIESYSLAVAISAVRADQGERGFIEHLRESADPLAGAVLLEDGAAVLGVLIAAIGIAASRWTGRPEFDAVGSIVIAGMLGAVAILLIQRNRSLLLGEAAQKEKVNETIEVIRSRQEVESIRDVKAVALGGNAIRFKAEVDFDGRVLARQCLEGQSLDDLLTKLDSPEALGDYLAEFGEEVVTALAKSIDQIEEEAQEAVPDLAHIDIEAD